MYVCIYARFGIVNSQCLTHNSSSKYEPSPTTSNYAYALELSIRYGKFYFRITHGLYVA
jgi:hypothetical protein